jgi:hypothetical protein
MPSFGLITRLRGPTKYLENSYFQKLILNWNKPEGLASKAEEEESYSATYNDAE